MGLVYADLELVSADDKALVRKGFIEKKDLKKEQVRALVDTGAYMMCINEHIQAQLDLPFVRNTEAELANGKIEAVKVVGPLIVNFENRTTSCNAIVMPGESEVLLGSIPMEDLDVVINPLKQTIEVNPHSPYMGKTIVKRI